jgi:rhodanese-related sulfurtransferase
MSLAMNDAAGALRHFEDKLSYTTGPVELERELRSEKVRVIDVRAKEDYEEAHIPGSLNLPQAEWGSLRGLERDKLNVVVCYSVVCHLAAKAAVEFAKQGFSVMEMDGGFKAWKEHELPIEKGAEKAKTKAA